MLFRVFFNSERKLRNGWWIAIFLGVLALILFPAILTARRFGLTLSMLDQAWIILAATWACQFMRKKPVAEVIGRFNGRWVKDLLLGGLIGSSLMLVPALFLLAGGWVNWQWSNASASVIFSGLLLMAAVAAAEELLFRGFMFQRLIAGTGPWLAQLLMGALFLLTHIDNPGMIGSAKLWASANIFLASVLFGLAFLRTGRLALPIGIHFMANVAQGTILGFGVSGNTEAGLLVPHYFKNAPDWLTGGAFGLEASAPGLVCILIGVVLFHRASPTRGH